MLQKLLEQNRESIITKWIDRIMSTYDPEMVRFLKKEKNQFANPVRGTIISSVNKIFDGLLNNKNMEVCCQGLEEIIKLRAVQDFSPSQALSFIFDLKKIIRNELNADTSVEEISAFEEKVDTLLEIAFDIYTKCRDKIYEIRLAEIKSRSQRAFELLKKPKT
jgi:hypothetical protein